MFDYVIVGAGSAGCVLANRLTEDPGVRVLLLEAGGSDRVNEVRIPAAFKKLFKTERDWDLHTAPQEHLDGRELYWPRGRMLGGSSSINAMIYMRGNPLDYDGWAKQGCEGWAWDDVLPYFRRSEDNERGPSTYHGVGGPLHVVDVPYRNPIAEAFVEACIAVGIHRNDDFNGAEQDGVGFNQVTQWRGARWSSADGFLRPAMERPNLTVLTGAHATRLLFDGDRVTAVAFRKGSAEHTASAGREVILAGGAIASPQLLLLSGVGPADELRSAGVDVHTDLPGVGRNLQDHIVGGIITQTDAAVTLAGAERLDHVARWFLGRRGILTSNVAEACAFVRTSPDLPAPDLQFHFGATHYLDHGLTELPGHGYAFGPCLLTPASTGTISLRSPDPATAPHIDPRYLSEGSDLERMLHGLRLAREIASAAPLDPFRGDELLPGAHVRSDEQIVAAFRARAETLYHPVGTCRMGVDDAAVVDPQLRVRGLDGVRVVDASIMPVIPRGNTNAPTVMIAEKAADLIRAST